MSCRLIPLPASISAGCGLALLFPWQMKTQVEDLLTSNSLHLEGVYQEAGKSWKAASMGKQ